jgi:NADH dehydrogenase/NADH:ubiquinone oxidoreductase subunit G
MIKNGEIKGIISFGDVISVAVNTENPPEFLVVQTAYTSFLTTKGKKNTKSAYGADVVLPAPAFGEVFGHVENEKNGTVSVNPALQPACGFQTRQLVYALTD